MKKFTFLIVTMALIALFSANELKGQNYAAPYLLFSNSAEASAYGEAYSTMANDASAAFWNPAGLAQVSSYSFSATSALGLPFDRQFNAASVAFNINHFGVLGISATLSGVDDIMGYTDQGLQTGTFNVRNVVLGLSYANRIGENFSFGVTGRYINQDLNVTRDIGYAFDIGARYDRELFTLGAVMQSLAGEIGPDTLPVTFRGGLTLRPIEYLNISTDFVIEGFNEDDPARRYANFGIGYELHFGDNFGNTMLMPRLGLNNGNVSIGSGFGFNIDNTIGFRVDYAFVNEHSDLFGTSHRIGLVVTGF